MTLQEVPTEILTESLLALADLRRKYKGRQQTTRYAAKAFHDDLGVTAEQKCPLCKFQLVEFGKNPWDRGEGACDCPWYWIEGHGCEEYVNSDGDTESFDDFPIPDRLARIARWEAAINAEIAGRTA